MARLARFAEQSDGPVGGLSTQAVGGVRATVALGVVMMCCLVAGPALAKGHGRPLQVRLVETSRVVPAYASATYAATCPSSHPHPVGGVFDHPQVALAASFPQGKRGWVVVVQNLSAQPQSYFAAVVCLRARARFAYPRTTYVLEPQLTNFSLVGCPRAAPHAITGYFNVQSTVDLGKALLSDYGTDGRGAQGFAGVKSTSGAPVGMYGGAVCTSLRTGSYGSRSTVVPGIDLALEVTCPRNTQVAVGGFGFPIVASDAGATIVVGIGTIGRRNGFVNVRNLTGHPVPYFAGALCVG